jgi:hypothetical protein
MNCGYMLAYEYSSIIWLLEKKIVPLQREIKIEDKKYRYGQECDFIGRARK